MGSWKILTCWLSKVSSRRGASIPQKAAKVILKGCCAVHPCCNGRDLADPCLGTGERISRARLLVLHPNKCVAASSVHATWMLGMPPDGLCDALVDVVKAGDSVGVQSVIGACNGKVCHDQAI